MAGRFIIKQHNTVEEIRQEMRKTKDGKYRLQLAVIERIMVNPNTRSPKIQKELLVGVNTITKYLKLYNEGGFKALKNMPKSGHNSGNPKWDNKIFEELFKEIDKQEQHWSSPKIQEWIESKYEVKIALSTIKHRLKRGGYSHKSSRPKPDKGDVKQQEEFKKKG